MTLRYLNIIHAPCARGSSAGRVWIDKLWLEDLRAQLRAMDSSMRLVMAAPLVESLPAGSGGGVEIVPEEEGFEYAPLPFYVSLRQYLSVRSEFLARLRDVVAGCQILHVGLGGHPVAQGALAWRIAARLGGKMRIWVIDGADLFPRMHLHAEAERNPVKRWVKRWHVGRQEAFCRRVMGEADLVFCHNRAAMERFAGQWDETRCHLFDRSFVTDDMLPTAAEAEQRKRDLMDASGPLRLVAAGRQIAIKATDHVLKAMALAGQRGAELRLDVYGDGHDLERFKALARGLGLQEKVAFRGTVPYGPEFFAALRGSQVMVITNLTAEISRNVSMAMALGLPLIIYRNAGTDAVIEESGAGVLVPGGDVEALARAMFDAWQVRRPLTDMLDRGLAAARANTLDQTHRRRMDLVRQVMAARTGSPVGAGV